MRLFFYYVTHSLLNTIKKLLKTWVAIFVVLMIFGGLVGGFMGMIISSLDKDSDNTVAVNVIDDEDGTLTVTDTSVPASVLEWGYKNKIECKLCP